MKAQIALCAILLAMATFSEAGPRPDESQPITIASVTSTSGVELNAELNAEQLAELLNDFKIQWYSLSDAVSDPAYVGSSVIRGLSIDFDDIDMSKIGPNGRLGSVEF